MKIKASDYLLALMALTVAGCANIDPIPITDDNRFTATGIRYFESRPFVVVNKPFPLASETALVDARISADGKTILISSQLEEPFLHFAEDGALSAAGTLMLPDTLVRQPDGTVGADAQGDEVDSSVPDDANSTAGKKTGTSSLTLTTDNTGMPIFALNEYLSMIYLPDFEREFVISTKARFGNKDIEMVRGPGGVLLGLNAQVDNSAILRPLMEAYGKVVSAGTSALLAAVSPGGAATALAQGGAVDPQVARELRDQRMTLRLHLVKFAAVGVYPVVKPSEVSVYQAVAGTDVLQPLVGYQIPYRYFKLLIAERLMVDDPLQNFINSENDDSQIDNECGPKLSASQATPDELRKMAGVGVEGLQISNIQTEADAEGCIDKVSFNASKDEGDGEVALSSEEKQSVSGSIHLNYGGTEVAISDPD